MMRIPPWLKSGLPDARSVGALAEAVGSRGLNTICFEGRCPNRRRCLEQRSLTFLVLGRHCTRGCSFCNVARGRPEPVDDREPENISEAARVLGLAHVVITSVARDDLADGGASHFRRCVEALRRGGSRASAEILTPDFRGDPEHVRTACSAVPEVYAHNVETVERLYSRTRDRASYRRSLGVLALVKASFPAVVVKSGLMLGLGETPGETRLALRHLSDAGCDIATLGQYMQPSRAHEPVRSYLEPAVFEELGRYGEGLGMVLVSGPRVRSSYRAREAFEEVVRRRSRCV